jgi:hypothetical protein
LRRASPVNTEKGRSMPSEDALVVDAMSEEMKNDYNWKRYWCPRGSTYTIHAHGFLYDPENDWSTYNNPNVKSFSDIRTYKCLALYGEPGIGKSTVIKKEFISDRESNAPSLYIDFSNYSDVKSAYLSVFESKTFKKWEQGNGCINIYLDHADALYGTRNNIADKVLTELLSKRLNDRLYLRVVCRTARWPNKLEMQLRKHFEDAVLGFFELVPLRHEDVRIAAGSVDSDTDAFMRELDINNIGPLAVRPVTLEYLLKEYSKANCFPKDQQLIYKSCCKVFLTENNQVYYKKSAHSELDIDKRFQIASQIAGIMLLCSKEKVWIGSKKAKLSPNHIRLDELSNALKIKKVGAVKQILDTGLFAGDKKDTLSWAHNIFPEYLAAYFLNNQQAAPKKLVKNFFGPKRLSNRIFPQIRGLVIWLSSMDDKIFNEIIKKDVESLFYSEMFIKNAKQRANLLDSALSELNKNNISLRGFDFRFPYHKFCHSDISTQLEDYIFNTSLDDTARDTAMDVARDCNCHTMQNRLVDLALEVNESLRLRKSAIYCILRMSTQNESAKKRLEPLVSVQKKDDPEDELKGCALKALWPKHISAEKLFGMLEPPQKNNYFGAYASFISELPDSINKPSIPIALEWVNKQLTRKSNSWKFDRIIPDILQKAWDNYESKEIRTKFAYTLLLLLRSHYRGLHIHGVSRITEAVRAKSDKRRELFLQMLPNLSNKDAFTVTFHDNSILIPEDFNWIVDVVLPRVELEEEKILADIAWYFFDGKNEEHVSKIFNIIKEDGAFRDKFNNLFRSYEIDSEEAQLLKSQYEESQSLRKPILRETPTIIPPNQEKIIELLEKFEGGDFDVWWHINHEFLRSAAEGFSGELEYDLTVLPLWNEIDELIKRRILDAAKKYLEVCDPQTETWFGKNIFHRPAAAGFRAFILLLIEEPTWIDFLSKEDWGKWFPSIISFPISSGLGDKELVYRLVSKAYSNIPSVVLQMLRELIIQEDVKHEFLFIVRLFEHCWDKKFQQAILNIFTELELRPKNAGLLIEELLKHGNRQAQKVAEEIFIPTIPRSESKYNKAKIAAGKILVYSHNAGWPNTWKIILTNNKFGSEVLLSLDYDMESLPLNIAKALQNNKINEENIADIYIWLNRQFPPDTDPEYDDVHAVTPRDKIADIRRGIINLLASSRNEKAIKAMRKISNAFSENRYYKNLLLGIIDKTLEMKWMPHSPNEIISLRFIFSPFKRSKVKRDIDSAIESKRALSKISDAPLENKESYQEPGKEPRYVESKFIKVVLLTEGKTDVKILEVAWIKLYPEKERLFEIEPSDIMPDHPDGGTGGHLRLKSRLENVTSDSDKIFIGMFDRDKPGVDSFNKLDKWFALYKNAPDKKVHAHKKAFAFTIPTSHKLRKFDEYESLCIEFLFEKKYLMKKVDNRRLGLIPRKRIIKIEGLPKADKATDAKELHFQKIDDDTKMWFAEKIVPTFPAKAFKNLEQIFLIVEDMIITRGK